MQKICFEYKGTMINITNKLTETFECNPPLITVREAIYMLNDNYDHKLDDYVLSNISVVLKNGDNNYLITTEDGLNIKLGDSNIITFFYPFKGG